MYVRNTFTSNKTYVVILRACNLLEQLRMTALALMVTFYINFQMTSLLEVLVLALTFFEAVLLTPVAIESACPSGCTCKETQITCGNIPATVPSSVANIVISEVSDLEFHPRRFCNVTWPNVKRLSVSTQQVNAFFLKDGVFECLDFLETFKFNGGFLAGFSKYAFSGFTSLLELDLSNCGQIKGNDVYRLLSVKSNFPNLARLILARISDNAPLVIDQNLVDVLCYRPIAYLDLSFNQIELDFDNISCLCESQLTTLIMQRKNHEPMYSGYGYSSRAVCSSLRMLDVRTYPPTTERFFKDRQCIDDFLKFSMDIKFFMSVRSLYYKTLVADRGDDFTVRNCLFWLFPDMAITEFHLTGNDLPNFDIMFLKFLLELIDISYNKIETINPNVFLRLPSLTKADISHNKLYKMSSDTKTWLALFQGNKRLNTIDLSFNQLARLPKGTFKSNVYLRELNLQGNRFKQIAFDISHLLGLEILDLRNNSVQFLDEYSRQSLQALHDSRQEMNLTVNSSTKLEVLLLENPLSCSCLSLDFTQWFVSSPIFSSSRHLYSCQVNDKAFPMAHAAIDEAQIDCDRPKQKRGMILLSSALSIIAVLLLVLGTINLYKRYKGKQLDQRYADRVRLLQENNIGFRYPVFLSYCSDDREFVLFNILRPLRVGFFLV